MKKEIASIVLIFLIGLCARAQALYFEHIDIKDGLSQNTVNEILQDSRGFMWFGTKDGLNRYDGKHFKIFRNIPYDTSGLRNSQIRCLVEDMSGRIWVGTNSGLYVYDVEKGRFSEMHVRDEHGGVVYSPILNMKCGPDGRIWIAVEGHGVYCHDPATSEIKCVMQTRSPLRCLEVDRLAGTIWFSWSGGGLFYTDDGFSSVHPFLLEGEEKVYPEDIISCIHVSAYNKIYLGLEQNGVVELNRATAKARSLGLSGGALFVREIVPYSAEELWIGTESGLFIYNIRTRSVQHLQNSPYDMYSLSDNAIYSICKDRDGGIWIGTFFGGVNYLPQRIPDFDKYYYSDRPGELNGKRVRKICPDGSGGLWVATEDSGLYRFDPSTGKFEFFAPSSEFTNIQSLLMDGDNLWVSTFAKGIRVIDTRTYAVKKYEFVKQPGPRLFSNNVFSMARTSGGTIYIGTMHGLQYYRRDVDGFGYVPQINGGKMVNDIMEDSMGNLWVGTISNGLFVQDARSGEWRQFLHDNDDRNSLPGNNITSVFEDSMNRIWVTTYGSGFSMYDSAGDGFCTYTSLDGMPGDIVYQIVEDDFGDFWISTNNGLVLFDSKKCTVERIYTVDDGLLCNAFNYSSSYKDDSGKIYFGCIEGMLSFSPSSLAGKRRNAKAPGIYVTDFTVLSEDTRTGESGVLLDKDIICTDSIVLRHWQNVFTVELAALGFSEDYTVMYRLEGVDGGWRKYDGGRITYSNIPFGEYCFRARLSDEYAGSGERVLNIRIRPPLWRSAAANVLYILLLFGVILSGIGYYHRMSVLKRRKYIREYERKKESEVYDTKIAFFTNITHEIRTPLTLIKGPLDNILSDGNIDPKVAKNLDIMSRNTDRLLVLVNQLLDFQKIEKENLSLKLAMENIPEILESTFSRFSASMSYRHKVFSLEVKDRDICAMVDREAFTKILSNMFTNAMKYSDRNITVVLERDGDSMRLTVGNDGEVVPADKREAIFTPFYRHTNTNEQTGTGIGLYLARSLAELQYGTLTMSTDLGVNEFVLVLPLCTDDVSMETVPADNDVQETSPDDAEVPVVPETSQETILVVEDDEELCGFISDSIGGKWSVLIAHNGLEALEILDRNNVTLIVSDIMMPEMDGIELCRTVKSDLRYTHIPLVLLTAKTTLESKITGMNAGADVYVEKPFSLTYLMSVIANQIKSRQSLREAFLKNPLATMSTVNMSSGDTEFLSRLREIIHENLNNSKFKMDDIAEMMHMSRANFYRKIKGVLDMSPNEYLRIERLKRAAQLLVENDYQVSEVCYMVGFSSPSYFSKCFFSQFGVHPKNFVKNQETKNQ